MLRQTGSKSKTLMASFGDLDEGVGLHRCPHQRVGKLRHRLRPFAREGFEPADRGKRRTAGEELQEFATAGGLNFKRRHGGPPSRANVPRSGSSGWSDRGTWFILHWRINDINRPGSVPALGRPCATNKARDMPTIADKRKTFRALHASGCFVMPNPWNVGTARYLPGSRLQGAGDHERGPCLRARASGRRQSRATTCSRIWPSSSPRPTCRSTPISRTASRMIPTGVAENVPLCVETGVAGLSIEDFDRRPGQSALRFRSLRRAREGRARRDRQGRRRLVLAAPRRRLSGRPARSRRDDPPAQGLRGGRCRLPLCPRASGRASRSRRPSRPVAASRSTSSKSGALGFTVSDLAALGVRRISVGGTIARVAWTAFIRRRRRSPAKASSTASPDVIRNAELNKFFRDDMKQRSS